MRERTQEKRWNRKKCVSKIEILKVRKRKEKRDRRRVSQEHE